MTLRLYAHGITDFEREYQFFTGRKWVFDFAWLNERVALEIEGGTWFGGRHTRGKGFEKDCEKYNAAAILGWRVLRVTTDMATDGRAIETLRAALGRKPTERGGV